MKTIQIFILVMAAGLFSANAQEGKEDMANPNEIYISNTVNGSIDKVYADLVEALKEYKFGVITEVDMAKTLKEKLDVDMKPYKILGVCNPGSAYEALQAEPNIGVFLPCKVILKEIDEKTVEVVSANPQKMMEMLNNEQLNETARMVTEKLERVIQSL